MRTNKFTAFLVLVIALWSGCYEPQDGCLDLEAVNYNFEADNNAPEECQYPELRIQFTHQYSTADTLYNFRLRDSVYLDAAGNPFTVNAFTFFISDFELQRTDGTYLNIEEELDLYLFNTNGDIILQSVPDNFGLVTAGNSNVIGLGTLREAADLQSLRFFVGVNGQANVSIADSIPAAHPLGLTDSLLYFNQDSGYVYQFIELFRDTTAADTIPEQLRVGTFANLQQVALPVVGEKIPGFNLKVVIQIDYRKWLEGINVVTDSKAELQQKIVGNTAEAFSLKEIVLE
ncbi:MAG: hypothetical protein RIC19_07390 [Phaeodactylibacter sp.]|uniref:MbnP family protein n=1 Tax=Phaeodactylibacter sp. TaxID=1940289 RepID=UPI0032EB9433